MPLYKYKCEECDNEFRRILDHPKGYQECPKCGGKATYRIPSSSFSTRYKGDGFYSTKDSKDKDK